jgi:hypothetical protein
LTHEVENSGDGTASQQSEVQTVTFNAGRGLGGTATLTYNDLYGQSWTTRPFNVGGDNVYRLEVAIKLGSACAANAAECKITFQYGAATNVKDVAFSGTDTHAVTNAIDADALRKDLLSLFAPYATNAYAKKDRANTIHVVRHYSATSVKLGGSIEAATRITYDIHVPVDMYSHDDNGGLLAFTAVWKDTTPAGLGANKRALALYQVGDRSAEIASALTSLPNQVIPSVTVTKVPVTDTDTNSDGAYGNAYRQSYAITFDNEANSGDQNMLTCNAAPCDNDGCLNRGPGVSEVRYMHHDPENRGEGINFVNEGYFIMDIGTPAVVDPAVLSAGSIKIMWDTGAGIDSAIFAVVATAAEVQTALRTITGWEAVTVELYGNYASGETLTTNHQFKVTFAAGYDDLGKSPTFYTMTPSDGAFATAVPTGIIGRLYDQRFSNSIWLGKVTGYVQAIVASNVATLKFAALSTAAAAIDVMPENGDKWVITDQNFGTGNGAGAPTTSGSTHTRTNHRDDETTVGNTIGVTYANGNNFAYLYEGKTSVQTSDYFAVGSTVEVLPTTWDASAPQTDVPNSGSSSTAPTSYNSNNLYRKFKVTGHVTNPFNREFAKLDSFPSDDGVTYATALADRPDYNLKITSNNGTVHSYEDRSVAITRNEVQVIILGTGAATDGATANTVGAFKWKLYYKGEETQDMDGGSSLAEIAEEINGFSALSGPVTVTGVIQDSNTLGTHTVFAVTFDEKDGDVAQMTAIPTTGAVAVGTQRNGWSIEAPVSMGLESMQAGGLINVTAREQCIFTVAGTDDATYYFCYDGICTSSTFASATYASSKITDIKDENGDSVLSGAVAATKAATAVVDKEYVVNMPMGKSCDGLEMRMHAAASVTGITKTTRKQNNGKQFKITRSYIQSFEEAFVSLNDILGTTAKPLVCATTSGSMCYTVQPLIDSITFSEDSSCGPHVSTVDGNTFPVYRTIASAAGEGAGAIVLAAAIGDSAANTCTTQIARSVITLDSMTEDVPIVSLPCQDLARTGGSAAGTPTTEAECHALVDCGAGAKQCIWTHQEKTLNYVSPVGSCSVSETTKGTYESYECSNRGACDGKSGLCTCYEGYSGQSCQTQTVLV